LLIDQVFEISKGATSPNLCAGSLPLLFMY